VTISGGYITSPMDVLDCDFNTYPDYIFTNPIGYTIGDGHPLANQAGAN